MLKTGKIVEWLVIWYDLLLMYDFYFNTFLSDNQSKTGRGNKSRAYYDQMDEHSISLPNFIESTGSRNVESIDNVLEEPAKNGAPESTQRLVWENQQSLAMQ